MFKRYLTKDWLFYIWLLSLSFYAYASVMYLTVVKDMGMIMKASLLLLAITTLMYGKQYSVDVFYRKKFAPLFVWILFWVICYIFFFSGAGATIISHFSFFLLPLIVYPIANFKKLSDEQFGFSMFVVMLVASLSYLMVFKELSNFEFNGEDFDTHLSASYLPVLILPCVLLSKNRIFHIIAWLLSVVIIFSSLKRGGIVAIVFAFIVYGFFYMRDIKGGLKKILVLVVGGVLLYFLIDSFIAFDESIGGVTAHRFEGFLEGGYKEESRSVIARNLLDLFFHSNPLAMLFGHGYLATEKSALHLSAHNDFLEVLFDFGIIGFIFYVGFHIHFIKTTLHLYKIRSEYAPSFAVFYSLYLIWSLVSIIILYPIMVFVTVYLARMEMLVYPNKKT